MTRLHWAWMHVATILLVIVAGATVEKWAGYDVKFITGWWSGAIFSSWRNGGRWEK